MNSKSFFIYSVGAIGLILLAVASYVSLIDTGNSLQIFEKVPEKPNDFSAYTRDIWKGAFVDLCELPNEYWKQPEFYGEGWDRAKKSFYDNPDYSKWGVYGQGNMPSEVSYTFDNFKQGETFELCSFFHNGFGIWSYQGFELSVDGGEYFDVQVTPNELMVSPTFPVFEEGWTQRINIKITPKKEVPNGQYELYLKATPPSAEYAREKTKEILKLEIDKASYYAECLRFIKDEDRCIYLINNREKKYVNGGSYQTSQPLLKIGVNIK